MINGRSFFSWETVGYSNHFTDEDKEWPRAKLFGVSFGPKFKDRTDGKSIGMLTDLNIFSFNVGNKTAEEITGDT